MAPLLPERYRYERHAHNESFNVIAIEYLFCGLCTLFTIGGAIITVGSRRPIRSAMGLLATIVGIAGCYLLLSAQFLAAIQMIVYAGAVVILFIFVVMLLGSAATTPSDAGSALSRYVGAGAFLASACGALYLVLQAAPEKFIQHPVGADFGTIEKIGLEIFTTKLVAFELSGALLLIAVVGAMAVARGKQVDKTAGRQTATQEGSEP